MIKTSISFFVLITFTSLDFFKNLERKCLALIMFSLNVKKHKSEYDVILLKMFENSLRYSKVSKINNHEIKHILIESFFYFLTAQFLSTGVYISIRSTFFFKNK